MAVLSSQPLSAVREALAAKISDVSGDSISFEGVANSVEVFFSWHGTSAGEISNLPVDETG